VSFLKQPGHTLEGAQPCSSSHPNTTCCTLRRRFHSVALQHGAGTTGSNAEVSGWLGKLPSLNRDGVAAAFLASVEYRGLVVRRVTTQSCWIAPVHRWMRK